MKKADLKKVATELNKVLELDEEDQIDVSMNPKELEKELRKCVSGSDEAELDIYADDEFSDEVWNLLAELGNEAAIAKVSGEEEEEQEDEEEKTEDEEDEEEEESGEYSEEEIFSMKKSDLTDLIEEEGLDIDPSEYKKLGDLKKVVWDALQEEEEGEEEEEEGEEEEEEEETPQVKSADEVLWDEISSMKKKELEKLIKDNDLNIDPGEYKKISELKKAVFEGMTEEEEEEEEKPAPKKRTKTEKKAEKKETNRTKKTKKGPGVIDSILEFIKKSSKKGITKEEILEKLTERFPDRPAKGMAHTINAQIGGKQSPCRLERTKDVQLKVKNGKYSIK